METVVATGTGLCRGQPPLLLQQAPTAAATGTAHCWTQSNAAVPIDVGLVLHARMQLLGVPRRRKLAPRFSRGVAQLGPAGDRLAPQISDRG